MNKPTTILTIFGASGDLAKLKIFPSIYALAHAKMLPENFHIIGYARSQKSREEFLAEFGNSIRNNSTIEVNEDVLNSLLAKVQYFQGFYDRIDDFKRLREYSSELASNDEFEQIAYFSVPPVAFQPIVENLANAVEDRSKIKLVIEKPFGENYESAEDLFHFIGRYFEEDQVYLLDHYLGKTSVRNILHLRRSNRILNSMIRGSEISNIQISLSEKVGVENRVDYFDNVGNIKDMFQSHILQILALITMDIPVKESYESLGREKYNILSALKFYPKPSNMVIGQYESYKSQTGVKENSNTETFAAFRLFIDKQEWYRVPMYVRFGKKMANKSTYIIIEFKKFSFQNENEEPNRIVIELFPEERIGIKVYNLSEKYGQEVSIVGNIPPQGSIQLPEYAQLISEVIVGNKCNFLTFPEILASWKVTDEILKTIETNDIRSEIYTEGTDGPKSSNELPGQDGFSWCLGNCIL